MLCSFWLQVDTSLFIECACNVEFDVPVRQRARDVLLSRFSVDSRANEERISVCELIFTKLTTEIDNFARSVC